MLRWQAETQRACEALEWLVVETRGDDEAGWGCHLLFRGDQWGVALYRHACCDAIATHAELFVRSVVRTNLSQEGARAAFAEAPEIPARRYGVDDEDDAPYWLGSLAPFAGRPWLMADAGREILVWDLETHELIARNAIHAICRDGDPYFKLAVDPKTGVLATGDGIREFAIWDLDRHEKKQVFRGHFEEAHGVAFLDNGNLISGSGDSTVRLWRRDRPDAVNVLETPPIYCVTRRPQGRLVACGGSGGGGGSISLVDDEARLVRRIVTRVAPATPAPLTADREERIGIVARRRDNALIACLAWHPDGRHFVTGGWDYVVKMFDAETGECVRMWTGHSHWVCAIAVTADGRRIVSGCTDGRIRIWTIDVPRCLAEIDLWPAVPEDFYIDGDRIYASCRNGYVYCVP
jgi:WD40 repeat protein